MSLSPLHRRMSRGLTVAIAACSEEEAEVQRDQVLVGVEGLIPEIGLRDLCDVQILVRECRRQGHSLADVPVEAHHGTPADADIRDVEADPEARAEMQAALAD